jgi:hypothetical protein
MITTLRLRHGLFSRGLCAGLLIGAISVSALAETAGAPVVAGNVEVSYRDPAGLVELNSGKAERGDWWLDELSRYVAKSASRVLPADQRLLVTITDVQRAGMFEPWRRGPTSDVRIVRDSTPPRIDLSFQLVSAQGAVLKEGARKLRDINFLGRSGWDHQTEAMPYEKNLIDDWLREDFAPAKR